METFNNYEKICWQSNPIPLHTTLFAYIAESFQTTSYIRNGILLFNATIGSLKFMLKVRNEISEACDGKSIQTKLAHD